MPYEQAYEAGFEGLPRPVPDIPNIQRLIGYQPVLDLPEMLERFIANKQDLEK